VPIASSRQFAFELALHQAANHEPEIAAQARIRMTASARYDFSLNPRASTRRLDVGLEREPLLQVDHLLRSPQSLVDFAAGEARFAPAHGPDGGYPGLRADAPLDYVDAVVLALDPLVRDAFGLSNVRLGRAECSLSLVTLPPQALVASQRVPHIDTTYPLQFAFLHYLCPSYFGGTAFYRHRRTGFETLTPERLDDYQAARESEEDDESTSGYIVSDTLHFEQTAAVAAEPNRLIVYRSRLLHSGQIARGTPLPADPRRGRLTANIFVTYLPAATAGGDDRP
jgi:hypothetical protein